MKQAYTHSQTLKRLLGFIGPLKAVMAISVIMRIARQLAATLLIALAAAAVARYVADPGSAAIWSITGWLVLTAAVLGTVHYIEQFTGHYVAFRLLTMLRNQFYDGIEPQAPAGTVDLRTGDAISRVINDCERIEPFYAHTIAPTISAIAVPAILLSWLWTIDPVLTWTLLPFLACMALVLPAIVVWLGKRGSEETRTIQGEVNAFLTDSFQGIRDTVTFGYGERRRQQAWAMGERLQEAQDRLTGADSVQRGLTELLIAGAALTMAWVGIDLVNQGAISALADLPVILAVTISSFAAVVGLTNVINDYRTSIVCANRLFELTDQPPVVDDLVTTSPAEVSPSVRFELVNFSYDKKTPVLDTLDFEVGAGRKIALVGASGAGKSTILSLLLRFWDADSGAIRIGGINIRDFTLHDLRNMIAVVSQRNYIFNTTIRENILVGRPDATQAEVEAAARHAHLAQWIESLPDGYETEVGEMGSKISGGQRQRLAIARALLKDAPILVLDEATSNLDVETEQEVNEAIRAISEGRTVLIIAHRLSTVIEADEILVLDHGAIVERGTHDVLLQAGGTYARLFELQQDEVDTLMH